MLSYKLSSFLKNQFFFPVHLKKQGPGMGEESTANKRRQRLSVKIKISPSLCSFNSENRGPVMKQVCNMHTNTNSGAKESYDEATEQRKQ